MTWPNCPPEASVPPLSTASGTTFDLVLAVLGDGAALAAPLGEAGRRADGAAVLASSVRTLVTSVVGRVATTVQYMPQRSRDRDISEFQRICPAPAYGW